VHARTEKSRGPTAATAKTALRSSAKNDMTLGTVRPESLDMAGGNKMKLQYRGWRWMWLRWITGDAMTVAWRIIRLAILWLSAFSGARRWTCKHGQRAQ